MKKFLKIFAIGLGVVFLLLLVLPFVFKDKIAAEVQKALDEKLDARVVLEPSNISLSLIRHFPDFSLAIENFGIINKAPFEGDTLVSMGELNLKMSIKELLKGKDESMNIEEISTENAVINILFNKDGVGNFDIALKNEERTEEKSKPLSLKIKINEFKL